MVNEFFTPPMDPVALFRTVIEGTYAGISCDAIESLIMRGDLQSATEKVLEMESFFKQIFAKSSVADAVRNASGMLMVIQDYKHLLNDALKLSRFPESTPHKPMFCSSSTSSSLPSPSATVGGGGQQHYSTPHFILVNRIY
jgi:hypothetical protein